MKLIEGISTSTLLALLVLALFCLDLTSVPKGKSTTSSKETVRSKLTTASESSSSYDFPDDEMYKLLKKVATELQQGEKKTVAATKTSTPSRHPESVPPKPGTDRKSTTVATRAAAPSATEMRKGGSSAVLDGPYGFPNPLGENGVTLDYLLTEQKRLCAHGGENYWVCQDNMTYAPEIGGGESLTYRCTDCRGKHHPSLTSLQLGEFGSWVDPHRTEIYIGSAVLNQP